MRCSHAIVLGAGIAGLSAAKALSAHFEKVTVLERDPLPDGPEARIGTPHCRQAHLLLRAGLNALQELFPDIEMELESAGAIRTRVGFDILLETPGLDPWPQRDLGYHTLCMSRPLVESAIRHSVHRDNIIALQPQSRVLGLEVLDGTSAVCAVRYIGANGRQELLNADLVIDASSRGSPTLDLLDKLGISKPEEIEIGIDVSYATALFEIPPNETHTWRGLIHRPHFERGRGAFLFPIENNRWQVSLNGMHGDMPPDDPMGFMEFARSLRTSTVYEAIRTAVQVGPIHRFVFPSSIRRNFDTLATFPDGLLPLGDAICRFNPALGQGMTVAAQQAVLLRRLLDENIGKQSTLSSLASAYFAAIPNVLAAPWTAAEGDFVYPKTRGKRPENFEHRLNFGRQLQRLAADDESVHRLMFEVNQLLTSPAALRDPVIIQKMKDLESAST
jgi:2-polyprenyl-6-methoxyphenol hydroxylase-like FAD-dependent oxidoreductase